VTDTHLLSNGHLRCGIHAGHVGFAMQADLWPADLRVTSNAEAATCAACREGASLPPVAVSTVLADAVEMVKAAGKDEPAMDRLTNHMAVGLTIGELKVLSMEVAAAMGGGR